MSDIELEMAEAKAAMHKAVGHYNGLLLAYNKTLRKPLRHVEIRYYPVPKKERNG